MVSPRDGFLCDVALRLATRDARFTAAMVLRRTGDDLGIPSLSPPGHAEQRVSRLAYTVGTC
jgi:hypothetical protein